MIIIFKFFLKSNFENTVYIEKNSKSIIHHVKEDIIDVTVKDDNGCPIKKSKLFRENSEEDSKENVFFISS